MTYSSTGSLLIGQGMIKKHAENAAATFKDCRGKEIRGM
jgi:hypothetical protein